MFKKALMVLALLLGAHLNLTALVPAAHGQAAPPWWVGGGVLWPFFLDTATLLPEGGIRDLLTPLLGIGAALCLLLAAAAVLHWFVPARWFAPLVVTGVVASIALQVIWISGWTVLPLALDLGLLWAVLHDHARTGASFTGSARKTGGETPRAVVAGQATEPR